MSITKSDAYESDLKTKRLFANLTEDVQQVEKHIHQLLTVGNAMRLALGRAAFGIAQIEALYVDQTEARRKVDAELFVTQAQLAELKAKIVPALAFVGHDAETVDKLTHAAERTATDRFVPAEPIGLIENVTYVDMHYICAQLKTDRKTARRYILEGRIRAPDSQTGGTGGDAKDVWIKSLVDQSIAEFQQTRRRQLARA
jgi:hypothetical protein